MRIRRTVVVLLSLALLVTACGDDDSTSADDRNLTETTPSPTTTAPDEPPSGDRGIAEVALLQLADFPPGWQEQPAEDDDPEDTESTQRIADCIGVDHDRIYGEEAEADSPTFVSPEGEEVSNSVGIESSEDEAAFVFETLSSDEAIACISEELQRFIAEAGETEDVEIGQAALDRRSFPEMGDGSAAYRLSFPVEAQGQSVDVHIDIVIVRVGRGGVTVQALSLFEPFDDEQLSVYTEIAVQRLSEALDAV